MFITGTDYIIILEVGEKPISIPDLLKLEEAGIETILLSNWAVLNAPWEGFLTRIDSILRETNLKIMMDLFYSPQHDWWVAGKFPSGASYKRYGCVDFENPVVGRSIDRCMMDILARVDRTRVQLVYGGTMGGEFLWANNNDPCPVPLDVLTGFLIDRQRICANQFGEVWMMNHHNLGGNLDTTTVINKALYGAFPTNEYEHYRIQYIQFRPGATIEGEEFNKVAVQSNPKSKYFAGSEWVEGLKDNYDTAMEHGVYGFLTSPMHTVIPYTQIEDWMLDNIKEAIRKLSLERHGE